MLKAQVNQEMINILEAALERLRLQPLGLDELIRKQLGREYSHNYVDAISKGKTKSIPADAGEKIHAVILFIAYFCVAWTPNFT